MRRFAWALLILLCFGIAGYAVAVYGFLPLGSAVHPQMQASFRAHATGVYAHVFAASVALLLGPLQFSTRLRHKFPVWHRNLGRIYLGIGILVGGLSGLYIAQYAFGGILARFGFSALALLWLFTGGMAFLKVRGKAFAAHREWMIRNFALTLAAVSLRLYLPVFGLFGVAFEVSYPLISWLCWVPNIVIAEWLCQKAKARGAAGPSPMSARH